MQKDVTFVFWAGGSGLADAMPELFARLEAKNIYLVRQSYGGLIAQITAKRHPPIKRK